MFRLHFMVNFVNTHKNFQDAQKLSGRQCRRADGVFLPLDGDEDVYVWLDQQDTLLCDTDANDDDPFIHCSGT